MKYTEALEEALQGRRIKHEDYAYGQYMRLLSSGIWIDEGDEERNFTLSIKLMKSDKWEVEPEKAKPIVVYGACDPTGQSYIFRHKPVIRNGIWVNDNSDLYCFIGENLFPKDRPVEYVLVKKEEYERKT
jgi:hypothetical protein